MSRILYIYDQAGSESQLLSFSRSPLIAKKYQIFWCDLRITSIASVLQHAKYLADNYSSEFHVVTGTSLNHQQWHYIWEFLRSLRIRFLCLIDSWQNIKGRFPPLESGSCLPDLILCIDRYVFEECLHIGIPRSLLALIGHSRISELVVSREALSAKSEIDVKGFTEIIFVSEPLFLRDEVYLPSRLTSLQKYAFRKAESLAESLGISNISIRLHPREPITNFSQFNQLGDGKMQISINREPVDNLLCRNALYVGLTSALLLELYFSGNAVVSFARDSWNCELSFLSYYKMGRGIWNGEIDHIKHDKCQFRSSQLINDHYGEDFDSLLQEL